MTPELLKWLVGALASCTCVIVGAVVWLSVLTFRIGQKYGRVEASIERFEKATQKLDDALEEVGRIGIIESKLEQLVGSHAEERRRFASEWPTLKSRVDVLWEKVVSISDWRKSRPQFGK